VSESEHKPFEHPFDAARYRGHGVTLYLDASGWWGWGCECEKGRDGFASQKDARMSARQHASEVSW